MKLLGSSRLNDSTPQLQNQARPVLATSVSTQFKLELVFVMFHQWFYFSVASENPQECFKFKECLKVSILEIIRFCYDCNDMLH